MHTRSISALAFLLRGHAEASLFRKHPLFDKHNLGHQKPLEPFPYASVGIIPSATSQGHTQNRGSARQQKPSVTGLGMGLG